ncbi:uncharacterized protein LOC116032429 [Ipomoea triloba]|uniref:uncharacterized protein LOC116032429 n=1 Tax=Ipomoea triloba TaxID=35885 RepID=UPI00125D5562|nr:uncharacterized protein LOC116032429 [Ipomoea triloba]
MGEIAVLRPQDPLKDRLAYNRHNTFVNSSFPSPKSKKTCSSSSNPNHGSDKSNRRKRSPQKSSRNSNTSRGGCASLSSSPPAKNRHLVMGQVKILKRGEALTVSMKNGLEKKVMMMEGEKSEVNCCAPEEDDDLALSTTDRLGPEPDMVPKQIKIADFYAGSAFISSPPPSSLPVPAFFKKKSTESYDDASSGLRRLLRLDPS